MQLSLFQLGWVIADAITGLINWLADKIGGFIGDAIESFASIFITTISAIAYGLQMGFFIIMDCIQLMFRKIAGLDSYYYQGTSQTGDMVLDFIANPTVQGVFWSVMAVACIMLFISTFIAIIKSEITEKGANPKGPIIGKAFKSILYFAMVPVVSIMGIFFANVLLKTLDVATAVNNTTKLSGMVFQAACVDGNRAQGDAEFAAKIARDFGVSANNDTYTVADAVNKAFAQAKQITVTTDPFSEPYMFAISIGAFVGYDAITGTRTADIMNFTLVYYYYDLMITGYDYLIGFIGGFIACSMLLSTCLGCIQRIFELTILFVVAPPLIAMMPMDNGAKYNQWRGEFVKRVFGLYGPIIGLNLMFMILTIIGDYTLFPDEPGYAIHNGLTKLFFMIVALTSLKEFVALIANLVGGNDAYNQGESKKEPVTNMAGKIGSGTRRLAQSMVPKSVRDKVKGKLDSVGRDENGEIKGGWNKAKHALVNPGSTIGGIANKKDGLISDLMTISGVGKGLKDKALLENPNSIWGALMPGAVDAADKRKKDKEAKDAREAKEAEMMNEENFRPELEKKKRANQLKNYADAEAKGGVNPQKEALNLINSKRQEVRDKINALKSENPEANTNAYEALYDKLGDYANKVQNGDLVAGVDFEEGKMPGVGGTPGGATDVSTNLADIENLLRNGIKVKLDDGATVKLSSDDSPITKLASVAEALSSAAEDLKAGASSSKSMLSGAASKLGVSAGAITKAAKGLKPETYTPGKAPSAKTPPSDPMFG